MKSFTRRWYELHSETLSFLENYSTIDMFEGIPRLMTIRRVLTMASSEPSGLAVHSRRMDRYGEEF